MHFRSDRAKPRMKLLLWSLCAAVCSTAVAQSHKDAGHAQYVKEAFVFDTVTIYGVRDGVPGYEWSNEWGPGADAGGGEAEAPTANEQETEVRLKCSESSGNPVVLYTGNKVEAELDFAARGEMPLYLARTYNRHWNGIGLFGKHWLSNFDYSLVVTSTTAWAQRPDGRRLKFRYEAATQRWLTEQPGGAAHVVRNADGSYTLHNDERGSERYDADGYVMQLVNEQGVKWTFAYTDKYLQRVTHSSGRSVHFTWSSGQLTQVSDPAGNAYRYAYTADAFGQGRGRLASATLPGPPATRIDYHYESNYAGALTGKSFDGVRYSTFAYDNHGRATLSEHAGGVERYRFAYAVDASEKLPLPPATPPPGGYMTDEEKGWSCTDGICYAPYSGSGATTKARATRFHVVETNPLGRVTTHRYEDGRKVSVTGDASPNCPASYRELTYDANGFEDIVSDFADRLTDFDYDAQGRLVKTVDGSGTPTAQTTLREWDTTRNRLVRVTSVGHRDTRYTYTNEGRLASVAVTNLSANGVAAQTRTTLLRYTQHANGLLATAVVDGPLQDDTQTSTYNVTGDLVRVENGLGQVTEYSQHNALGLPGRVTGSKGDVTEYDYDARGRVVVERTLPNGSPVQKRYVHGASGLLDAIHTDDGNTVVNHHDTARRLIQQDVTEPGGTFSVRRITYNAMSVPIKVEVGRD